MSNTKILVVDDDDFQLDLIGAQLQILGWQDVLLVTSGTLALMEFDKHGSQIEVIISDLSMPDMDGLVLMRHLAQRGFKASFILLSGMDEEILSSAAGLAHAHHLDLLGFLSKPCDSERLNQLLTARRTHIDHHSPARIDDALTTQRLTQSLSNREFIPWYQPKVNLLSGRTVSYEALARWPTESGGMIGPGRFVPAIEAAGLADELFFSMLDYVLHDLAALRKQGAQIKAAINLSMDTALDLDVPERMVKHVHSAGLQPEDLIIEVTESKLMADRSIAMETLTRLSLMGFALSIDDFGTGYSSLVQLVDLPFRELKIDASFVQRSGLERKAEEIVRLSATIGHHLGMNVIAEGVETEAQMAFLRTCGDIIVQGYYLAKPMPFSQFTEWLQREGSK